VKTKADTIISVIMGVMLTLILLSLLTAMWWAAFMSGIVILPFLTGVFTLAGLFFIFVGWRQHLKNLFLIN